ncbi:DUF2057 family protein [Vibrio astriarenae]
MIKRVITAGIAAMFVSVVNAKVVVKTDNRVEILAVNQSLSAVAKQGKGDLQLNDGINQLLVRVTAIYDTNGGKRKFNSLPLVVKFEASDQTVLIETPFPIRDERDVSRFQSSPTVLLTSDGKTLNVEMEQVTEKSFKIIKDYDELLAQYNSTNGIASVQAQLSEEPKVEIAQAKSNKHSQSSNSEKKLQDDFLKMTPQERQEFVSWAVKHLND